MPLNISTLSDILRLDSEASELGLSTATTHLKRETW